MENLIKIDDLGVPRFLETPIYTYYTYTYTNHIHITKNNPTDGLKGLTYH